MQERIKGELRREERVQESKGEGRREEKKFRRVEESAGEWGRVEGDGGYVEAC